VVIRTTKLGFAAYIKMHGGELISCSRKEYEFELRECDSERARALEIEYYNSCCYQHDREVMSLRNLT